MPVVAISGFPLHLRRGTAATAKKAAILDLAQAAPSGACVSRRMRPPPTCATVPPALFVGVFWGLLMTGVGTAFVLTALRVVQTL